MKFVCFSPYFTYFLSSYDFSFRSFFFFSFWNFCVFFFFAFVKHDALQNDTSKEREKKLTCLIRWNFCASSIVLLHWNPARIQLFFTGVCVCVGSSRYSFCWHFLLLLLPPHLLLVFSFSYSFLFIFCHCIPNGLRWMGFRSGRL